MRIIDNTSGEDRKPIAWVVRSEYDEREFLVFRDKEGTAVAFSNLGIGKELSDELLRLGFGQNGGYVITKRYYPGDTIAFVLDKGFAE